MVLEKEWPLREVKKPLSVDELEEEKSLLLSLNAS